LIDTISSCVHNYVASKRGGGGGACSEEEDASTGRQFDRHVSKLLSPSSLSPRPSMAQKQKFTFAAPSLSYAGAIVVAAPTKVGHAIQLPLEPNCLPANCSFYWHVIFN